MEPIDIWRSAKVMVDKHGKEAPFECALKADDFLDVGEPDGQRLWMAIRQAAIALIEDEPAVTFARPPADYPGPYRAWGPTDDRNTGRHDWKSEIAPTLHGPFTSIRPHALEWWDGKEWVGTD